MNTYLPIKKRESIIVKIKKYFFKLFNKDNEVNSNFFNTKDCTSKNINTSNSIKNFLEDIKMEDLSRKYVIKRKLENKEIQISDLSDEQLDVMIEFYGNIVRERKNRLQKYS